MRIAAYASTVVYWRHLAPVVGALRTRGIEVDVWARDHSPWGNPVIEHLGRQNIAPLMLVASYTDAQRWTDRSLVMVEHGAGQTYDCSDLEEPERSRLGYPGGGGLDHVALFICPSQRVAEAWHATYPNAQTAVVGCPALDRYFAPGFQEERKDGPVTVAVTCHWRYDLIPEGRPALPYYIERIADLGQRLWQSFNLVGHGHPRIQSETRRWWETIGCDFEPDPDVILSTADLLICDSSSLAYEAAAVGVPVLSLNAPFYRREVEHGLRFWSAVPGLQCDEPDDLDRLVHLALTDPPEASALRHQAAQYAYAVLDGHAADRAADAILTIQGRLLMAPGEMQNTRDEIIDRLYQLGASDQMAQAVRDAPEGDPEIERLRRANDVVLAAEIAHHQRPAPSEEEIETGGYVATQEDLDASAADLLAAATSDDDVIALVGSDADLAARLFRLEDAAADPSPGLLQALAAVAGIDYTVPEPVQEPTVEPEPE